MKEALKDVATKADLQIVKADVQTLKVDVQYLKDDVQDIKRTIRLLEKQSNEFVVLLKDTKAEMLKWMLVFWASHLTLLLGYLIFLK